MGSKFVDESLKAHNEYRKKHGVPQLKQNKEITAIAQKWADHLAKTGTFQHSANRDYKGQKMGENIAMKWTSSNEEFSGNQVTDQWYDEVKKYNFKANSGAGTGSKSRGFASLFGRKSEPEEKENVVRVTNEPKYTTHHYGTPYQSRPVGGSSTQTSRKVITETKNGKTYTKTIVTETTIGPDGKKSTTTHETVTEAGGDGGATGGFSSDYDRRFKDNSDFDRRFKELSIGNDRGHGWTSTTTHNRAISPKDDKKEKEKKPQKMKDFIDDVVKCHNKYRKKHAKVGDLKKNKELDVLAQRWADHLAATRVLKHSDDTYKGDKLGENVASRWSSEGADYTGQEVTDQWYSEISKYDFRRNEFTSGTGHFTQVVWKDSKEIGVGKSFSSDGRVFVVCNYFPAGNFLGQFRENVFPAKD